MLKVGSLFAGIGGLEEGFARAGCEIVFQVEQDPACLNVLRRHYPDAVRYTDIREVTYDRLEEDLGPRAEVDVLVGGWPCFVEGTTVLTDRGLLPIEQVQVGDRVVSHLGKWSPVTAVRERKAETVVSKGMGHPGIESTPDHPFFTSVGWVPAKELAGHEWASLLDYPSLPVPPIESTGRERPVPQWSPEVAWLAGRYVGDGWARVGPRRGRVDISCDPSEVDDVVAGAEAAGFHATVVPQRTAHRVVISSRPLARWLLAEFGSGASTKTMPGWIFGDPHRETFLEGYVSADGCASGSGWKLTSTSRALAVGSRMIAVSLGYSVSLYLNTPTPTKVIAGRTVNQKPWWQVVARRQGRPDRRSRSTFRYRYGLVREVETTNREQRVFDLTVGTDESFIADGLGVHNCQDLSLAGFRAGLAGRRSGLFFDFARIAAEVAPRWVVAENVPGLLSSWSPVEPGRRSGHSTRSPGSGRDTGSSGRHQRHGRTRVRRRLSQPGRRQGGQAADSTVLRTYIRYASTFTDNAVSTPGP